MNRIVLLALLLGALLIGAAAREGGISSVVWEAAGCEWDPNGCPEPQPTTDAGCEADPNGRPCRPGS